MPTNIASRNGTCKTGYEKTASRPDLKPRPRRKRTDDESLDKRNGRTTRRCKQTTRRQIPLTDPDSPASDEHDYEDESFLVDQPVGNSEPCDDEGQDDEEGVDEEEWYGSEAQRLIAQQGSERSPGNFVVAVPRWALCYFDDTERAMVFSQLLYWFGLSHEGRRRARRKEDGRSVVDKTHQQLAKEIGLKNKRRIEKHLKAFEADGLIAYRVIGYGSGKTTRIRLLPNGVRQAYLVGCQRLGEMDNV